MKHIRCPSYDICQIAAPLQSTRESFAYNNVLAGRKLLKRQGDRPRDRKLQRSGSES